MTSRSGGRVPIIIPSLALAVAVVATACDRSDASIESDVRSRLIVDNITSGTEVTVTAKDGVVHLSGRVRSPRQRDRARAIATEVVGADKVVDDTRVDERPLAKAVREAVERDPQVGAVPIDIDESTNGIVVLKSGQTTAEQRRRLVEIASGVPGVSHVEDQMK